MVKMTDDDLETPYKIAPGTPVRVESLYEGDNRLLGMLHPFSGSALSVKQCNAFWKNSWV